MAFTDPLIIAVPKGRIAEELAPLLAKFNVVAEADFFNESSRKLMFTTNHPLISLIRVRSFDVPTFVNFGAAHIGIAGSDVLEEHGYADVYAPLDLRIGRCHMAIAALEQNPIQADHIQDSHVRVATKYPEITSSYFAKRGIQAECIKLNGAIELAPLLHLSDYIVDLVSSGATLKANGLKEVGKIMDISSHVIVSRHAYKTKSQSVQHFLHSMQAILQPQAA